LRVFLHVESAFIWLSIPDGGLRHCLTHRPRPFGKRTEAVIGAQ
jgi:hypothetical protein